MIVIVGLVSFFSGFGIPKTISILGTCFITSVSPVPLSFPFYAYVYSYLIPPTPMDFGWIAYSYSLDVLGIQINAISLSNMHIEDGYLYFAFFLLVNIIGAIGGYWLNKEFYSHKKPNYREAQFIDQSTQVSKE